MSLSWKSGAGHSLLFAALFFACGGWYIHRAEQLASAAEKEQTTTARNVTTQYNLYRRFRFNYYDCGYSYQIGGKSFGRWGNCPELSTEAKSSGILPQATVYYDPDNPSLSSLLEFSTASEHDYQYSLPWMCLGILSILSVVFFAILDANRKRGGGGIVVDAHGTVIYPDEVGNNSETAVSPTGAAANSAPSMGLRELYLEVINTIHPDRAANEVDRALREQLTKEVNVAFNRGDAKTLREVLDEYRRRTVKT